MQHWLARSDGFVIVVDEPSRVLSAKVGAIVPIVFEVTNVTNTPVKVVGVQTGCGCTSASPIPCTIQAHESQKLSLTLNLGGQTEGDEFILEPVIYVDRPARRVPMFVRVAITPSSN